MVALVGESGSGKTTLARALALLGDIDSGQILLHGKTVNLSGPNRIRPIEYYGQVQMIFQDPFASLNNLKTVRHIIGRALKLHGRATSRQEVEQRTLELLETVHLTPASEFIDRYPSSMSGGQRQRLAIASAQAEQAAIYIFDEPTSGVGWRQLQSISALLRSLAASGAVVIVITHDHEFIQESVTRIIDMTDINKN